MNIISTIVRIGVGLVATAALLIRLVTQSNNVVVNIGAVLGVTAALIFSIFGRQVKKIGLIALGIGIGIVISLICFFFSIESYWPFDPHIDTQFSKNFSKEAFDKIKIGSSTAEVESILGDPLWKQGCGGCWETEFYTRDNTFMYPQVRNCTAACNSDRQRWQYSDDGACSWWDFAWEYYAMDFHEGKVVAKYVNWHGD